MDPTITAGWIGAAGGLLGGAVGGGIAYTAAVKSLTRAAAQAEAAQRNEWTEVRRRADEERDERRRAALLALSWELEVNQELLERLQGANRSGLPPLLAHVAMDAALAWFRSLPDTARGTIREAQHSLVHYNVAAEYMRAGAAPSVSRSVTTASQDRLDKSTVGGIEAFARARSELAKELGL